MRILVTGAAGFIGSTLSQRLLARGDEVLGYDNLNDYYDPSLKQARLQRLLPRPGFQFVRGDLEDRATLERAFADFRPERVVNPPPRPACATRWRTRMPTSRPMWSASSTSLRPAATVASGT